MGACNSCMSTRRSHVQSRKEPLLMTKLSKAGSLGSTTSGASISTSSGVYGIPMENVPQVQKALILAAQKNTEVSYGLKGLTNFGNSCYLNAALQCLLANSRLSVYFLYYDWQSEVNKKNPLGSGGKLVSWYAAFVQQVFTQDEPVLNAKPLFQKLQAVSTHFAAGSQEDAQELLTVLLDQLHEDLNRVLDKPTVPHIQHQSQGPESFEKSEMAATLSWQNYLLRNKSVIVDLFQGQLKSTVRCKTCSFESVTFDPFMYLSLPINPNDLTLKGSFDLFSEEEHLSGSNAWYCETCQRLSPATKQVEIWKLPDTLMVHLKRFKYCENGTRRKLDQRVRFPTHNLNLSKYLPRSGKDVRQYDLYSVLNHHGTIHSGHYTSVNQHEFSKKWYLMNDSKCKPIKNSTAFDLQTEDAYVLFYCATSQDTALIKRQSVSIPQNWPHSNHVKKQMGLLRAVESISEEVEEQSRASFVSATSTSSTLIA